VYTAHWDHLGIGPAVNGDTIYNGAKDNAVGTAGLLEIARAFTKLRAPPRRSILLLAVTAEEQGLLGSQYYSVTPVYPLAKTAAAINIDGLNVNGRTKDLTLIGLGASDLDEYARDAASEQGRVIRPDPEPAKGFYGFTLTWNDNVSAEADTTSSRVFGPRASCPVTSAASTTSP
jgi:Zn-dependent M28 family amino/carboxypeptidase